MLYSKLVIIFLNFFDYFQQRKIIKLINSKISEPLTVFDVGAHHGETIKLFLEKLKIKKIYSFEASPKNFLILKKNFLKSKKNYSEKVEIYNFGIGDKISKTFINQTIESSSSTINKIDKNSKYLKKKLKILKINDQNTFSQKIPIELFTLDFFIEKHGIQKIDLLKIDTEGYEFNVLKGASRYIQNIKLIYFEHHYDDMIVKNYKFRDINTLLINYGFEKIKKTKMLFRKSFEYVYQNKNN